MNNYLQEQRNEVANYLLERIKEDGKLPWDNGVKLDFSQHNPLTGKRYRGGNILRLYVSQLKNNFDDPRWVTMAQLNAANKKEGLEGDDRYKVKKGSKGTKIEYWKTIRKGTKEYEEYTKNWSQEQKDEQKTDIIIGTSHTVFNAAQIENFPPLEKTPALSKEAQVEELEKIIANSEAKISYDGHGRNFYKPSDDSIHLTEREGFISQEHFYGTAIHEIAHSTGHKYRLNRKLIADYNSQEYALEELNAEFTSAFMNNRYDFERSQKQLDNHAAYLQHWATAIEKDPNVLFKAIQNAEKIVDYIEENMLNQSKRIDLEHPVHIPDVPMVPPNNILDKVSGRIEFIETISYPNEDNAPTISGDKQSTVYLGGGLASIPTASPTTEMVSALANGDLKNYEKFEKNYLGANPYKLETEYTGEKLNQLFNDLHIDDTLAACNFNGYNKTQIVVSIIDKNGQKHDFANRIDLGDGNNFKLSDNIKSPLLIHVQNLKEQLKNSTYQDCIPTLEAYEKAIQEKIDTKEYEVPSLENKSHNIYKLATLNVATDLETYNKSRFNPSNNHEKITIEQAASMIKDLDNNVSVSDILEKHNIPSLRNLDKEASANGYDRVEQSINEINSSIKQDSHNAAKLVKQIAAANSLDIFKDDTTISDTFKTQLTNAEHTLANSNYKYKDDIIIQLNNMNILTNTKQEIQQKQNNLEQGYERI